MRCATASPGRLARTNPCRSHTAYSLRFPASDQRCGQLKVGGDDEVPVVDPGKSLGLARAAMVGQQLVVQVEAGLQAGRAPRRRC
jgi:hypothetical protein